MRFDGIVKVIAKMVLQPRAFVDALWASNVRVVVEDGVFEATVGRRERWHKCVALGWLR